MVIAPAIKTEGKSWQLGGRARRRWHIAYRPSDDRRGRAPYLDDRRGRQYLEIAEAQAPRPSTARLRAQTAVADRDAVAVIDFGSQYSQLIARRVREHHVYCELIPHDAPEERVRRAAARRASSSPAARPASTRRARRWCRSYVLDSGKPILGICYGMQLLAHQLGGEVEPGTKREYGPAVVRVSDPPAAIFRGSAGRVLGVDEPRRRGAPTAARLLRRRPPATTRPSPRCGTATGVIGIQFHPEVVHTSFGSQLHRQFPAATSAAAPATGPRPRSSTRRSTTSARQVGSGRVICALSGGVDSAVVAALVHRAVGDQLTCIFVDNGLLRRGEPRARRRHVRAAPGHAAGARRRGRLVSSGAWRASPTPKKSGASSATSSSASSPRRRASSGTIDFLAQGTLYPDVIESTSHDTASAASRIKTHHNVGPAREPAVPADRAAALPVQGRSARGRRGARPARGDRLAPAVPGPWPEHPRPRRSHRRAPGDAARRRRDRHGRGPRGRAVPPAVAELRGAHAACARSA